MFRSQGDRGGQQHNRDWKTDSGGREGWGGGGRLLSSVHVTFPRTDNMTEEIRIMTSLCYTHGIQSLIWRYFTPAAAGIWNHTHYIYIVSNDIRGLLANDLFSKDHKGILALPKVQVSLVLVGCFFLIYVRMMRKLLVDKEILQYFVSQILTRRCIHFLISTLLECMLLSE